MRSFLLVLNLAVVLCLVVGCGNSALPPPVTVTYRDSLVGAGKVLQIKNDSAHHLYNVRVTGREYKNMNSASVRATEQLKPGALVEVGWMEFEAWMPEPGESIEIYADNYAAPYVSMVPE